MLPQLLWKRSWCQTSPWLAHRIATAAAPLAADSTSQQSPHQPASRGSADPEQSLHASWNRFLDSLRQAGHPLELHRPGRPPALQSATQRQEQQRRDTRALLQSFARSRPDLLYALPHSLVSDIAQLGVLPRDHTDKHLTAASRRMRHSFAATAAHGHAHSTSAAGTHMAPGPPVGQASLQDLLRVVHDWTSATPSSLLQGAPEACGLIGALLEHLRATMAQPAVPEHMQKAQGAVTPTMEQLMARQSTGRSSSAAPHLSQPQSPRPGIRSSKTDTGQSRTGSPRRHLLQAGPTGSNATPTSDVHGAGAYGNKPQREQHLLPQAVQRAAGQQRHSTNELTQEAEQPGVTEDAVMELLFKYQMAEADGLPAGTDQAATSSQGNSRQKYGHPDSELLAVNTAGAPGRSILQQAGRDHQVAGLKQQHRSDAQQQGGLQEDEEEDYAVRRLATARFPAAQSRPSQAGRGAAQYGRAAAAKGEAGSDDDADGSEDDESDDEQQVGATDVNQPGARQQYDDFYSSPLTAAGRPRGGSRHSAWDRTPRDRYALKGLLDATGAELQASRADDGDSESKQQQVHSFSRKEGHGREWGWADGGAFQGAGRGRSNSAASSSPSKKSPQVEIIRGKGQLAATTSLRRGGRGKDQHAGQGRVSSAMHSPMEEVQEDSASELRGTRRSSWR